jgi:predicted permease
VQQIHQNIHRLLSSKATAFLKKSFFFSLLYSTLLYIIVRLFFYEFPFTIGEGFELLSKILLVVWIFIIGCKLVFASIARVENTITRTKYSSGMWVPVFKKIVPVILVAALAYMDKAGATDSCIADAGNNSSDESVIEPEVL